MKKGNLVICAICALLGALIIGIASGYPGTEAYGTGAPGPGLWPILIAIVMLLCVAMLLYKTLVKKEGEGEEIALWTDGTKRAYLSMGILLVYATILPIIGFIVSTIALMFGCVLWFSKSVKTSAISSVAITMIIYCVFRFVLNVPIHFGLIAF